MKIFIRSDASTGIGAGHVMRCSALAEELRDEGAAVSFLCREQPGSLVEQLMKRGFRVHLLPLAEKDSKASSLGPDWETDAAQVETVLARERQMGPVDWLIVDHYDLDARWESRMRPHVNKIMVIDDLADRPHDCDLLLDQNFYRDMEARYDGLVPAYCQKLIGPRHAVLRKEFRLARRELRQRTGDVNRVLVFFAGADPTHETVKAVKAIQLLGRPGIAVDVAVAEMNLGKEQVRAMTASMPNATFYCQPENLAKLMAKADLSIGASGSTTWERCCLGLPTLVVCLAANQETVARDLAGQGAVFSLGSSLNTTAQDYHGSLLSLLSNAAAVKRCSEQASRLVDGEGVSKCLLAMGIEASAVSHPRPLNISRSTKLASLR